jgi:hypothetical protein
MEWRVAGAVGSGCTRAIAQGVARLWGMLRCGVGLFQCGNTGRRSEEPATETAKAKQYRGLSAAPRKMPRGFGRDDGCWGGYGGFMLGVYGDEWFGDRGQG